MTIKSVLLRGAVCLALGVAGVGMAHAAGDPEVGARKAKTCLGCHGVAGSRNAYPSYTVPKLGGQHPEYLVTAMQAYQQGLRDHDTMEALLSDLSDEDLQDIAAFFAQPRSVQHGGE